MRSKPIAEEDDDDDDDDRTSIANNRVHLNALPIEVMPADTQKSRNLGLSCTSRTPLSISILDQSPPCCHSLAFVTSYRLCSLLVDTGYIAMSTVRSSPRKNRKAPTAYKPGDENAFGEHSQPNEMGTDIFKDKRQRELIAFFQAVLEPKGWRKDDRPPPTACANFAFVPTSLTSIGKIHLYKHGIAGKHYAVEWTGLRTMRRTYNLQTYAPVLRRHRLKLKAAQSDWHCLTLTLKIVRRRKQTTMLRWLLLVLIRRQPPQILLSLQQQHRISSVSSTKPPIL
jgi:hypothetical protein